MAFMGYIYRANNNNYFFKCGENRIHGSFKISFMRIDLQVQILSKECPTYAELFLKE
jgi:hypothetical protein